VCFGNFTYLRLVGIGYKVEQLNNQLKLNLGYSHSITLNIPENIQIFIPKGFKDQKLTLFGLDLESVTLFRSQIREICKPEVYKGKGIRFENEVIVLKENKKNN
jgi:large subunit ribosomal protein L6|tara:strand:- start:282 stop:593 length:312 start_codon:yes stop_codon:yes gene_type:complete